ncbi:MAG: asparaginase domain-containing protein [Campylobacteraceae bacterium]
MDKILIINSGGTFNKVYNPLNGELEVERENRTIKEILSTFYNLEYELVGAIYKDSSFFTIDDRRELKNIINSSTCKSCLIVHGTDTMELSAKYLKEEGVNKTVVLTGAMVPYSISKTEAISNFAMCLGFLIANPPKDVYIGMHGYVARYENITKNRQIGRFELKK